MLADEVEAVKPDPAPYEAALQKTGVAAEEALAFEDSVSGISSSVAAGVPTVGITSSQESGETLDSGSIHDGGGLHRPATTGPDPRAEAERRVHAYGVGSIIRPTRAMQLDEAARWHRPGLRYVEERSFTSHPADREDESQGARVRLRRAKDSLGDLPPRVRDRPGDFQAGRAVFQLKFGLLAAGPWYDGVACVLRVQRSRPPARHPASSQSCSRVDGVDQCPVAGVAC